MVRLHPIYILSLFIIILGYIACEQNEIYNESSSPNTCEGCHLDRSALQKFASEIPPVSETEGGG